MRISVVVPVYNEETTIVDILDQIAQVPLDLEVVIVDDASTDRTWTVLQELRQQSPFNRYCMVRHQYNQGKGVGLRTGFAHVTGDLVVVQDADREYDPREIPLLVHKWEEETRRGGKALAVYGVRDLSGQKFTTRWGNRFLTLVTNILFGSRIRDMETCYKLMPGVIACQLPMEGKRFDIEPEITACLIQAGYTILEVPISYYPRVDKKLVPWKDGFPALAMLFRRRFLDPFKFNETFPLSDSSAEAEHAPVQ